LGWIRGGKTRPRTVKDDWRIWNGALPISGSAVTLPQSAHVYA
jgi:hypothetical protein